MDDRHDHQHDTTRVGDRSRTDLPPVLPDPAEVEVHTPLDAGTGPDEAQLDPAKTEDEDDGERFDAG